MKDIITVKYFGEIAEAINCNEEQISTNTDNLSELLEQLNIHYDERLEYYPATLEVNWVFVKVVVKNQNLFLFFLPSYPSIESGHFWFGMNCSTYKNSR